MVQPNNLAHLHYKLISDKNKKDVQFYLENIMDGIADKGPCLQPCSKTKFDIRNTLHNSDSPGFLYIQFDEIVQIHKSTFVIDEITLMTRIGGIIGVGKELLWVMIVTVGFVKILITYFFCDNYIG